MRDVPSVDTEAVQIVEIMVSSRTTPGWRRDLRLLMGATGLAGAVVFGVAAHLLESVTLATAQLGPAATMAAPPTSGGQPSGSTSLAQIQLIAPPAGSVVRGPIVILKGTARVDVPDLVLEARLGRLVVGRRTVAGIVSSGPFEIELPVDAPAIPAVVEIDLQDASSNGAAIASTSVVLSSRFAVDVWSISTRSSGGRCVLQAHGPASLGITSVRASIADGERTLTSGSTAVSRNTTSDAARFLRLGQWTLELGWPIAGERADARRVLRLEIFWRDRSDGTASDLSVPFVSCGTTGIMRSVGPPST
jgi:hypothetical protein